MASIEASLNEIAKRYQADPSSNQLKSLERVILSAVFFDDQANKLNGVNTVNDFVDTTKKFFNGSAAEKESIKKALTLHGYDTNTFHIVDESKKSVKVTLDELFKAAIQRALNDKNNDVLLSRVIELQNYFIQLKQRPSDENIQLMKGLPGYEYIEEYWLSAVAPLQPLGFELFEGATLSSKGAEVLKSIFNKYDMNNKGQLSQAETTLLVIALTAWNTVLESDSVSFEDLKPLFEDPNRKADLLTGVRIHQLYLNANDKVSYNEVLTAYTRHAASKQFKGVTEELNTSFNVLYLALNAFAKLDTQIVEDFAKFSGLNDLPALIAISECESLSTLAQARDCLTLGLKYWQKSVLSEAPLVKAPFFKKLDKLLQHYVTEHKNELEESLLEEDFIKMICMTESAPDLIARKSCRVFGGRKVTLGEVLLSEASIQEDHFFGRSFWHMNPKPLIKFFGLVHRRVGTHFATAIPMCISLAKTSGVAILECLNGIAARELIDALKASLEQTALACVLPYDFEGNNIKSAADVNATLAQYLEFSVVELPLYFNSCQMVQPQQNVGEIIWQDYQTLLQLGVDRKALADKLAALIALARYRQATREWRDMLARNPQFKVSEGFMGSLKRLNGLVRRVLGVDPEKIEQGSAAFPYRVELRETRGHHEDPFHPSFAMQSYYLEGDYVWGSADVTIVNTALEQTHKELSSVTLGDMLPYLIRVGCFFEGPGVPYRVDPHRLCTVLELIHV